MRLVAALALGTLLGSASAAIAIRVSGEPGTLRNWAVFFNGEGICLDPWIDPEERSIECSKPYEAIDLR